MFDWTHEQPVSWETYLGGSGSTVSSDFVSPGSIVRSMGVSSFSGVVGFSGAGTGNPVVVQASGDPDSGSLTFSVLGYENVGTFQWVSQGSGTLTQLSGVPNLFGGTATVGGTVRTYVLQLVRPQYDAFRLDNVVLPFVSGFLVAFALDLVVGFLLRHLFGPIARVPAGMLYGGES
jgi:hypothetical protein